MEKRIIALVFGSLFAAGAAVAGEKMSFQDMDKDGDGQISQQEAQGTLQEKFQQADADSDGNVTQAEFSAFEEAEKGSDPSKSQ